MIGYLERALDLSAGSVEVRPVDILVNERHGVAILDVSGERRGRRLRDRAVQVFRFSEDGRIAERWVHPGDAAATDAFWGTGESDPPGQADR